jgi:nucleoside-diphosphate-sugar epimerase
MFGSGATLFHPAYVEDVVDGFVLCLRRKEAVGEVFILGGEEYLPLREFTERIARALNVPLPRWRAPLGLIRAMASACEALCAPLGLEPPLYRRRVSFFQNNRAFRVDKAKRLLGYQPRVPVAEGLARTVAWYREHGWLR